MYLVLFVKSFKKIYHSYTKIYGPIDIRNYGITFNYNSLKK